MTARLRSIRRLAQLVRAVALATGQTMHYVYILKSEVNGRLYTGSTGDWKRRLQEHNQGKSKYTRLTRPFMLLRLEEFTTRSEAVKREMYLKTGRGRQEIELLLDS